MMEMKVEIVSKKWIKPAIPTPSHLQRHQLSLIDQLHPSFYISAAFHYDDNTTSSSRIGGLEESLSKVLTLYYPFAGRYDEDESAIICKDQGLEFVVATIDQLVDGQYDSRILLSALHPTLSDSPVAYSPVTSVQVNVFSCGGIVIALRCFHKVGDMPTFFAFVDAWATTCRVGTTIDEVVGPSFNFSSLMPPTSSCLNPSSKSIVNKAPPAKYVLKQFIFTGEALSRLKSSINSESSSCYSRVELVTAIITTSLINIERSKGMMRRLLICQAMSLRSRIFKLLPNNNIGNNAFGNLLIRLMSCIDVKNGSSPWEIKQVAGVIRKSIRDMDYELRNVGDWRELSEKVEKAINEFNEEAKKGEEEVNIVRFTSWRRFPFHKVDFGFGKPRLVSMIPLPFSYVALMDHHQSTDHGIVAGVCLKEDDLTLFQQQPDILAYAITNNFVTPPQPSPKIRSNI